MQCVYSIKIKPLPYNDRKHLVVYPYHEWLEKNNITQYDGGDWKCLIVTSDVDCYTTFQFKNPIDYAAFKLMWIEQEYVEQS